MELFDDAAMEQLQTALEQLGPGALALEVEGLESPRQLVRLTLQGAHELDWTFDEAWKTAMNRLQPSQAGGSIDAMAAAELREDRQLIEEDRPIFQAVYEGREPTTLERAQMLAAAGDRVDRVLHAPDPFHAAIPVRPEQAAA